MKNFMKVLILEFKTIDIQSRLSYRINHTTHSLGSVMIKSHKCIGFKVVRKLKIKNQTLHFLTYTVRFVLKFWRENMSLCLFSVFTSVCREDPLLSGNCLLSTMVTTCFQSSQYCRLRNLRHLKMPLKKITPNRHERVGLNMKVGDVLSVCLNEMPRMGRAKRVQPVQKL